MRRSSLSSAYIVIARPICFRLLRHMIVRAFSLAWLSAGSNRAARIEMIAMTTSNSISVKAPCFGWRRGLGRETLPEAGRQTTAARRLRLIRGLYHRRHFKQEKIAPGEA